MRTAVAILMASCALARATEVVPAGETIPRPEHPRPNLRRDAWKNLNGPWHFCFDPDDLGLREQWPLGTGPFDRRVTVPFSWQSDLSGIGDRSGQPIGWYRRTVRVPDDWQGQRVWLCFGAVYHETRVWVDGRAVGRHEGGYTPFAFDITDVAPPGSNVRLDVRAFDPHDPELPAGRYDHGAVLPGSGIWQTVWLEARPPVYVDGLRLTPARPGGRWVLEVEVDLAGRDGRAAVALHSPDPSVREHRGLATVRQGRAAWGATLEINRPKTWSPEHPHLYDLELSVTGPDGQRDLVHTYFGLRTIERAAYGGSGHERILLNGTPVYLRGALDPSWNAEGLSTAPDDAFLRNDIEAARQLGLNLLKIHLKADEPRRLYWADKLGMLLWQEMPATERNTERSRAAWEAAMRAVVRRDRNHPSLIGWTLFHDSRGLGGRQFKNDPATQRWVYDRVLEVREQLDPSRLVEDNATSLSDHVETDVNSWHVCTDDYWIAREHIGQIVARTRPGSPVNYVPGLAQTTAPLLCGPFSSVPAEGGDVSWGLRFLITQLRRHSAIQGHIAGAFYDVPWRRDGLLHSDRSPKAFGYDAFVPQMTPADLQQSDFVGFDAPPVIETAPGEELTLPVFVSRYSNHDEPAVLRWQVMGTDDLGRPVATPRQTRDVAAPRGTVTYQTPLRVRIPDDVPFVGALTAELVDTEGRRIAANYVNLIADEAVGIDLAGTSSSAESLRPRVEVLAPRLVVLRIPAHEFAAVHRAGVGDEGFEREDELGGFGAREVEYRIALPHFVRDAVPAQMVLMAELAVRTVAERRSMPPAYNTSAAAPGHFGAAPGSLGVYIWNEEVWQIPLPNDPADSRGVLSHHARFRQGSYGELVRRRVDLTRLPQLRENIYQQPWFPLVFRAEGPQTEFSIYGRQLGQTMIDPTLVIQTARQLGRPVGFVSYDPVTIERLPDPPHPTGDTHAAALSHD